MNKFLIIFVFTLVTCDLNMDNMLFKQFQRFIKKYHKKYNSVQEFLARFEVFKTNTMTTFKGNASYKTGITKFSDLTQQEFSKIYLNLNYDAFAVANFNPHIVKTSLAVPSSFDWRDKGFVTPVRDQGACGASWDFATVANLEGIYFRYKNSLVDLSEQILLDCNTYNDGCVGGSAENSIRWLVENGIETEEDYPYTGKKGTCKADPSKYIDMKVTGYRKLGPSSSTWSPIDEDEIKEFLYETSPLVVALNAIALYSYTGGIIDVPSSQCPASGINHVATLVGYGHDDTENKDYWTIKNSWGENWGEDGYFRIKRGSNTCGINNYIATATVSF